MVRDYAADGRDAWQTQSNTKGGLSMEEHADRPYMVAARTSYRYLSQFCTVGNPLGADWRFESLEDGLEPLSFSLSNGEALMFARIVMEANGIRIPDGYPDERELIG